LCLFSAFVSGCSGNFKSIFKSRTFSIGGGTLNLSEVNSKGFIFDCCNTSFTAFPASASDFTVSANSLTSSRVVPSSSSSYSKS